MKLQRNTDEIKSITDRLGDFDGPIKGMLRGQELTIYNLCKGVFRILAHREAGGLSWIGYWFNHEPNIHELEEMTKDSEPYLPKKLRACGTHFYYSDVADTIDFKLGVATLMMDQPVTDILDLPDEPRKDYPWGKAPKVTPVLSKQLIREQALTPDTRKHYKEVVEKLRLLAAQPKSWERGKDTLYCFLPHELSDIPQVDRKLFITLLTEEFKDITDSVVIGAKNISLDVYF